MICPRCTTSTLDELDRSGIQIDRCSRCRGVWLDRGELEKLITESSRREDTHDETEEADDGPGGRRDRGGRSRRNRDDDEERGGIGGFLSNLFD